MQIYIKKMKRGNSLPKMREILWLSHRIYVYLQQIKQKTEYIMKTNILLTALLVALPFNAMAQDDDMYFVPSKKSKTIQSHDPAANYNGVRCVDYDGATDTTSPDYHIGALRNDDEYNRRGHGHRYGQVVMGNDTLVMDTLYLDDQVDEKYSRYYDEEDDYRLSHRLVRFHGGIRSPYYWDYYYNWAYDPWYYDPWYYDSWYYGGYYGWHSPYYYNSWYSPYYYSWHSPWYYNNYWGYGYYGGHWGSSWGHSHHNYAYRGGTSGARYGGTRGLNGGFSASRGTRGALGSSNRSTRVGTSATRGTRVNDSRSNTVTRTRDYTPTSRSNENTRVSSTRSSRTESTSNSRSTRDYTPTRSSETYTPSRSSSSSSSSSFGGGSSSRSSGGSFGGGGSRGGGGGGRGGR